MQMFCTGVFIGCLLSLFLPTLPAFFKIIFILSFLLCAYWRSALGAGIVVFLLSWHWQLTDYRYAQQYVLHAPHHYHEVVVQSWRALGNDDRRVVLQLAARDARGYQVAVRWRQAHSLAPGQRWRLPLSLQVPVEQRNPIGLRSDIQALLAGQIAQGYVLPDEPNIQISSGHGRRWQIDRAVQHWTAEAKTAPLLRALTLGERQFSADLWQGIQYSGLGHVLTISGLHIGLVFGWVMWVSGFLLRRLSLSARLPAQLLLALASALAYAWLAGFAIPTMRAVAALMIVGCSRLLLRPLSGRGAWLCLVALLLVAQPFWLVSASFWLSIVAVGCILLLIWRLPRGMGWWGKLTYFCYFQLLLTLLMSILGLAFFGGMSSLALLSNVLFVTWCSLIAIPTLLVTLCWSLLSLPFSAVAWQFTDWLFLPLWYWLHWAAEQPVWWSTPQISPALALMMTAAIFAAFACHLSRRVVLYLSVICLCALVPGRQTHERLILFATGQSTVLLVQQAGLHWLYIDANASQLETLIRHQIMPQLRGLQITQLQAVVMPKAERDMLASLALLEAGYPDIQFYVGNAGNMPGAGCAEFAARVYPASITHWPLPERDPCVLSVTLQGWQVLLPGRLSVWQEQALMLRYPHLDAHLYLLADYGRPSANSLLWLQHLAPVLLFINASEQGAYRYPLAAVEQRRQLLGLPLYHAGRDGALTVTFHPETLRISAEKHGRLPRWLEKAAE